MFQNKVTTYIIVNYQISIFETVHCLVVDIGSDLYW